MKTYKSLSYKINSFKGEVLLYAEDKKIGSVYWVEDRPNAYIQLDIGVTNELLLEISELTSVLEEEASSLTYIAKVINSLEG